MTIPDPEWRASGDLVPYPAAMEEMEKRVEAVIAGHAPELIWLLQHPPLYTAGTSAAIAELKDAARFPVFETGRGGRYTYHGPGQRVIYAIVDLRRRGRDVRTHVWNLEQWMIDALGDFGIKGERREGRIGIWVAPGAVAVAPLGAEQSRPNNVCGEEKIGAIGVRVRKWVAYHGLSINVDPDLSHFSGIVPCGLDQFGVTSFRKLGVDVTMAEVDAAFRKHANSLFKADKHKRDQADNDADAIGDR